MRSKKEYVILILGIFLIVTLSTFVVKYIGYAIQTTPSQISIDTGIRVIADEFDGSTSDFLRMNDIELESIENMILENTTYGKIVFSQLVNLTSDAVNNIVDIDSNAEISYNFIEIDTGVLTSLEKPATLYLYGLNFTNPRILKNGAVCSSSVCNEVGYSNGILVFTTTQFSDYSAEETTEEVSLTESPTPAGGGIRRAVSNFSINKDLIKVSIKQGETKREILEITNTGDSELNISLNPISVGRFMALSENQFYLKKGKTKMINVDIFARENEIPEAYIGRIVIQGNEIKKVINFILEVKEKKPLFDIKVEVINKTVDKNQNVAANISITNFGDLRNMDVILYIAIKDFDNNIIIFRDESLAIDKDLSLIREIKVPEYIPYGQYVFYSKVSYENISASSADVFDVKEKEFSFSPKERQVLDPIIFIGILLIILIILLYLVRRMRRKEEVK